MWQKYYQIIKDNTHTKVHLLQQIQIAIFVNTGKKPNFTIDKEKVRFTRVSGDFDE